MADTTLELNAGTGGTDLAGDDNATTGFHQYLKLKFGGSGTQTVVTSTVGLPVNLVQQTGSAVTVDGSAVTQPVSGTVTANLSATDNAVLDQIEVNTSYGDQTGGGLEASALRVTLASDSTGVLSVDDNGASLTVDNGGTFAVQAAQSGTWTLGANSGVDIGDVDVTSVIPGTGATNAGKAVDSAAGATDTGVAILAVRDDALTTLTPIDGDYVNLRVSSTGALHVTGGGGGTEYNEDDATPATIVGTATLMERDDAITTVTPIEGDWIGFRGTAEGALWVQDFNSDAILADTANIDANITTIETNTDFGTVTGGGVEATALRVTIASDSTGVVSIDDNGGAITVDNGGTFATQVDGAALTALQLIDNPIVAHDAAASGSTGVNMIGGLATNSIEGLTQVAANDASRITTDLNGVVVTRPHTTLEENLSERITDTTGTSTNLTTFGAPGANVHNYITSATVWNSSATDGYVDLRDGSAGSIVWTLPAPTVGGCVQTFDPPLKFSANTAVAYDVSGALSTVYLSLNGFSAQG